MIILRVKCIVPEYYDKEKEKYIKHGETLDVKQARGNYLVFKGIVEPVKEENSNKDKSVTSK